MKTFQEKIWTGKFGKKYIQRNNDDKEFNKRYIEKFGIKKNKINKDFYKYFKKNFKFLKIDCNVGMQLKIINKSGFKNLFGIDIQQRAINEARKNLKSNNFFKNKSNKILFPDNSFDVVLTNDVLIHMNKNILKSTIREIYRTSKKFVWCFEYYANSRKEIRYRGQKNLLWKDNFSKYFPKSKFKLIKSKKFKYISKNEKGNIDEMFLLQVIK